MLCYKDISFCNCKNCISDCDIKLSEKIFEEAKKAELYVSVTDKSSHCKNYKERSI